MCTNFFSRIRENQLHISVSVNQDGIMLCMFFFAVVFSCGIQIKYMVKLKLQKAVMTPLEKFHKQHLCSTFIRTS